MLELYSPNLELLNTKERITVDLIKDGQDFLKQFEINHDFLLDTVSLIYRYLRIMKKIPHNLHKYYITNTTKNENPLPRWRFSRLCHFLLFSFTHGLGRIPDRSTLSSV